MRRWAIAGGLMLALCATAGADRLTEEPEVPAKLPMGKRLKTKVNLLSDEVALHLNALSFDMIDMDFDLHKRVAKVRLGGWKDQRFSLGFDSNVVFRDGAARVRAKLDLNVLGEQLSLDLPEFDMVPRTYGGRSYVELRLPVFEGSF
jgi:hypothetical protein